MVLVGGESVRKTDQGFMEPAPLVPGSNGRLYRAVTAALDTATLQVDKRMKEELKFVIYTGAHLSLCKCAGIIEGSVLDPRRVVNVRGTSSCAESAW